MRSDCMPVEREDDDNFMTEERSTELKLKLNQLVWEYGANDLTLKNAEDMVVDFWSKIVKR